MIVCWLYWLLSVGYHYFAPYISTICKYRMRITLLEEWLGGITGFHVTFRENVCTIALSLKKYTKLITLKVFSIVLSVIPSLKVIQKNKVAQKVEKEGESNKRISRFRTFLEVPTKFEKTNNSVYSVLLSPNHSESLSDREEHRSFCELS